MMNSKSISISVIILLIIVTLFLSGKVYSLNQKNVFHRNKVIENDYLKKIVNDSKFELISFQKKWGKDFHKKNTTYLLESETALRDQYFKNKGYVLGKTDFYGYEFEFDDAGNLKWFNFFKP